MPNLLDMLRDHEARLVELEASNSKLWRHVKRISRKVVRISARLPEGRIYERGSTLRIPPRPTQMLRNAGIPMEH